MNVPGTASFGVEKIYFSDWTFRRTPLSSVKVIGHLIRRLEVCARLGSSSFLDSSNALSVTIHQLNCALFFLDSGPLEREMFHAIKI